jgi:hypothetical protein
MRISSPPNLNPCFYGIDTVLGPEMRSTGEVLGMADSFGLAFYKAEEAALRLLARRVHQRLHPVRHHPGRGPQRLSGDGAAPARDGLPGRGEDAPAALDAKSHALISDFGRVPIYFVPNRGQADDHGQAVHRLEDALKVIQVLNASGINATLDHLGEHTGINATLDHLGEHTDSADQAIEQAGEIEVPPRAKYIRTALLELERIHSHLLWLGIAGHIIGFETVLMQAWRIREPVMWLCEQNRRSL